MWSELDKNARLGLVSGIVVLIALTIVLFIWAFSSNNVAIFSKLDENEAANIVAALEDMKVPFSLEDNGTTILVDEKQAQTVKIKLVGQGVPMNAGSGFELFDNADIGMTEYSQKINYLRAMQGELARSIMAIDGVKYARVHLVLPETSIFRQKKRASKASVTVIPEPGSLLNHEQILGIQRLVASAAPGIEQQDVTIIDNNGVTLSSVGAALNKDNVTTLILQKKREAELYLHDKIMLILNKTFGDGNAIATVSVDLVVDKVHRKEELVLPGSSKDSGVVHKRESTAGGTKDRKEAGTKTVELDYQLSRRIEEIVSMPGAIQRINVGVLVPEGSGHEQIENLRDIISMSVGLDKGRGDDLAIYPMKIDVIGGVMDRSQLDKKIPEPVSEAESKSAVRSLGRFEALLKKPVIYVVAGLGGVMLLMLVLLIYAFGAKKRAAGKRLSVGEREKLLGDIKQWLNSREAA